MKLWGASKSEKCWLSVQGCAVMRATPVLAFTGPPDGKTIFEQEEAGLKSDGVREPSHSLATW